MDDLLSEALVQGIQQLVLLGAGLDSRPYRFRGLKDGDLVFEVDHPVTRYNFLGIARLVPPSFTPLGGNPNLN